jgi:hypothetical protein
MVGTPGNATLGTCALPGSLAGSTWAFPKDGTHCKQRLALPQRLIGRVIGGGQQRVELALV